jgi:hypothetical protein
MPVTISGVLSQVTSTASIQNVNKVFVNVIGDAEFLTGTTIDCSLDCVSFIATNATIGASDNSGVTKRVIVNIAGDLDGWSQYSADYPGRTLVRFLGSCVVKNATFIYRGGEGKIEHEGADGSFVWGWDGGVWGDAGDSFSLEIQNVEIICPVEYSTLTGYWDSGGTLGIKANRITNLFVRNASTIIFDSAPTETNGITIVDASWGAAASTNLTLKRLVSFSFLLQEGAIATLVDSQVSNLRWFVADGRPKTSGYVFRKTFQFNLAGSNQFVRVSCYDKSNIIQYQGTTDSAGKLAAQEISYIYVSQLSSGIGNSPSLPGNPMGYPIAANKCVYHRLPLKWFISGYKIIKQSFLINEINHTLESNLLPIVFSPVLVGDQNITNPDENAVKNYSQIADLSQLYDRLKVYSVDNPLYPAIDQQLAIAVGKTLNLRNLNLVLNATSTQPITVDQTTNTIVIKTTTLSASDKFSSLETTGNVTSINGAIADFAYKDASGISFKVFALPPKARVRITKVSDGTRIYVSANNNGEAIAILQPTNYVARADCYLYYRSEDIPFNGADFSLRLPLNPYRDKNGIPIASINPDPSEINLLRVDYTSSTVYVKYSASHPVISRDSLLYALEKFQSGYNPDIPESQDIGLDIDSPVRYQNEQFVFDSNTTIRFAGENTNNLNDRPYIRAEIIHLGNETPWGLFDTSNGRSILLPSGQVITPNIQVSGGFETSDRTKLLAIPENPLLTNDSRINNLDSPISSRATPEDLQVQVSGQFLPEDKAKLQSIPSNPLLTNDVRLNRLDAAISSRATADDVQTSVTVSGGFTQSDRTTLESIPGNSALAILASQIEPNWSVQRLLILFGATLGGKSLGSPLSPQFRNLSDTKTIVSATISKEGNRTEVNYPDV